MAKAEESACPACDYRGGLTIEDHFFADPIGSASLAGHQIKVTGRRKPVLRCGACRLYLVGEYEGQHALFEPQTVWMYDKGL